MILGIRLWEIDVLKATGIQRESAVQKEGEKVRKARKYLVILLAVAVVFCIAPVMAFAAVDGSGQVDKIVGDDRYDTAAKIAIEIAYPDGANAVVIANGEEERGYADAMSGSLLASVVDGPLLLASVDVLPDATKDALIKLNPEKAYVLGGELSVSQAVVNELKGLNLSVERIDGQNRYDTAAKILKKSAAMLGVDKFDTALIVNGVRPADALSAGAYANNKQVPILLVNENAIPDETKAALIGVTKSYAIGGNLVISDELLGKLPNAERIAGRTRYDTCVEVAKKFWGYPANFALVKGTDGIVDALAGCVLGMPILYVESVIPQEVDTYVDKVVTMDSKCYVLGGRVSDDIVQAIREKIVDARIGNAIDKLDLTNTGISGITYKNKTAIFTIEDPDTPIINSADNLIELFRLLFKDVTNADIYIKGIKVGTIGNPAGMTDDELMLAIGEQLILPLVDNEPTDMSGNLSLLVDKSASAKVTIVAGSVEYKVTYTVKFVAK